MGLLSRTLFPEDYVQPKDTVLVSEPTEWQKLKWLDGVAAIVALSAILAYRLSHIPGSSAPTNMPLLFTSLFIVMVCGIYAAIRSAKRAQFGRVVLTTTDLSLVQHRRVVSAGPLYQLRGVMSFRPNGSETIEYWVAMFEHGANIRIYANHSNGQEMADRLARMVPAI